MTPSFPFLVSLVTPVGHLELGTGSCCVIGGFMFMSATLQGYGCTAEHSDLVLFTLFHYFGRLHRWHAALEYFQQLSKVCGFRMHAAMAQQHAHHSVTELLQLQALTPVSICLQPGLCWSSIVCGCSTTRAGGF